MRSLLFSLLLAGCSTDLDTFSTEAPIAACDYAAACGGALGDDALCEEAIAASIDDISQDTGCEYKPRQASQCLRELTAETCEEKTALYYECKRTFRGEGCSLDLLEILY